MTHQKWGTPTVSTGFNGRGAMVSRDGKSIAPGPQQDLLLYGERNNIWWDKNMPTCPNPNCRNPNMSKRQKKVRSDNIFKDDKTVSQWVCNVCGYEGPWF